MPNERILFFAPYAIWHIHHPTDTVLGWALRIRGCDILLARCDGIYGEDCYVRAKSSITCEQCKHYSRLYYDGFNVPTTQISSYLASEDYALTNQWVEKFNPEEYLYAEYEGRPIGEWMATSIYTLLATTSRGLATPTPEIKKYYKRFLVDGLITYIAVSRMVDDFKPSRIVLLNGRMIPYRLALEVAEERNIEAIVHEKGLLPGTRRFSRNCTIQDYKPTTDSFNSIKDFPLKRQQLEVVKKHYFLDIENNAIVGNPSFYSFRTDPTDVRNMLQIPPGAKIVGIFTTSEWERAWISKDAEKQLELTDRLIDLFRGRDEYLVVRHHPNIHVGRDDSGADVDFMTRAYKQALHAPVNVRIIMPTEKLTSHALVWNLDAAISFFSTVAMEASLRGLPVAVCESSLFASMSRYTINDFNTEGLSRVLESIFAADEKSIKDDLRKTYRYGYHMLERRAFRFKSIGSPDIDGHGIMINSIAELSEGVDPDLDMVCDKIIRGGDFIKVPNTGEHNNLFEEDQYIENELEYVRAYREQISRKSKEDPTTDDLCFGIIEVLCNDLEGDDNLLDVSLGRSRYKDFTKFRCVTAGSNNHRDTAKTVLRLLGEIHEDYVVLSNKYFGYDESLLSTAKEFFVNGKLQNTNGIMFGGWIISPANTIEQEIFTERTKILGAREAVEICEQLSKPQNVLSFCVFRKTFLARILKGIIATVSNEQAIEYIFGVLAADDVYKVGIPMVLCKLPKKETGTAELGEIKGRIASHTVLAATAKDYGQIIKQGEMLFAQGDTRSAISVFEKVAKHSPNCATAYNNLGVAYWKLRDVNKAIGYLEHAYRLNNRDVTAGRNLATAYKQVGQTRKAAKTYRNLVTLLPNDKKLFTEFEDVAVKSPVRTEEKKGTVCEFGFEEVEKTPSSFQNELYKQLDVNYDNFFHKVHDNETISIDKPLIYEVKRVSFGLSNICCYSHFHKKCPLYRQRDKVVLPSKVVYNTIDELAQINYEGVFAFHFYNEPLIDPRLFSFMSYAHKKCPLSKTLILTNGFYLTQQIANELAESGVWILGVTSYTRSEHQRLVQLDVKIPYYVFYQNMDARAGMYERSPINVKAHCFAPVGDVTISWTGDVVLCCLDWKGIHKFGNLNYETLSSILNKDQTVEVYRKLIRGERVPYLCQRCDWVR